MPSPHLFIGHGCDDDRPVELRLDTLLRHLMALGSSGSGKTVLSKIVVEEVVSNGVPAICLDPQGDLCSLALAEDDPGAMANKGVDPVLAREFAQMADVVVFTPAARKGVPLSADPIRIDPAHLSPRERLHAFTATATMIASLLADDLGSDDGEGLVAVFDRGLNLLHERGMFPCNLADFTDYWMHLDETDREIYGRYLNPNKIEQACRKLARLDVGARRLLFHEGIPLDIDMLLGRGDGAVEGKTRISVIYLNTLHSQEDKEYFVAALTQRLYTWMLDNPSKTPQALFYIDEVAPYIPPVRKPACKDGLTLLFKQARKYGIGCLMATQNPADVDYKAMAQFGTWVLGRLTTRQDLKKVQPMVKSLDPSHVEAVMDQLPAQKPGEFLLISPDNFDSTRPIRARWLYTRHETLDEDRINQLANERWRWRFPVPVGKSARETGKEHPRTAKMVKPVPERADTPRLAPAPSKIKTEADMLNAMEPPQDLKLVQQAALLARTASMSAGEFATRTKVAESTARSTLKRLVGAGLAGRFKEGRSTRFWAIENGLRPDLGLTDRVKIIVPLITRAEAERLGHNLRERALLGMIGDDEELVDTKMEYRPLYRISFQEKVRRPLWKRLFSRREFEHRAESVYLHPRSLKLVVFKLGDGISLHERPEELASEIEDFDGVVRFEERAPGKIRIDEHEWQERRPEESLVGRFQALYQIRPEKVEPVFVPFWRLHLRVPGKPGTRIVTIDALSGFPLDW